MVVYLPEPKEIHPDAIKLLKKNHLKVSEDEELDAEVIFVKTLVNLDKKYLDRFKKLKYILRAGVGLDNIDLKTCAKRGIKVFNAPGSNSNAVAEYTILATMVLLRNFGPQVGELESGRWRDYEFIGGEIKGKVIGLIGCGAIGKLAAKKFNGMDPKVVLGYDPFIDKETLSGFGIKKTSITRLLKTSDIVSLHLPLNNDTKGLIGVTELMMIKDGAIVISAARGGIIDEKALIKVLESGKPIKVALDVYENEPQVKREFLNFENVVTTPHIAAFTEEAQRQMSIEAAKNFIDYLRK